MHFGHHRSVALKATVVLASAMSFTLGAAGANAQELTGTLKKIKETGEITIGYRDASVPFSYLDGDQKPVGYAFEICKKIAEAVKTNLKLTKLEVRLNPVTSATRIPLIANGTVDLECGSTTNNVDRQKQVSFTNTHFLTATRYVAKKSAKLDTIEDLKGKTRRLHLGHHQYPSDQRGQYRAQPRPDDSAGQGSR